MGRKKHPRGRAGTWIEVKVIKGRSYWYERTRVYLDDMGVATSEFAFHAAVGNQRAIRALRTQSRARVEAIQEAIRWPRAASDDWSKGFLAGIFDAEGSYGGCIRIANTGPQIIGWTEASMRPTSSNQYRLYGRGNPSTSAVGTRLLLAMETR